MERITVLGLALGFVLSLTGCVLDEVVITPADGGAINASCIEDADCQSGLCAASTKRCVECKESIHCPLPEAARCASNQCVPCVSGIACSHLSGTPACNEGACVECTPGTEEGSCGGTSCNPETFECTETPLRSRDTCQACITDSECETGDWCVALVYGDDTGGNYCLTKVPPPPDECEPPYSELLADAPTVSGAGPFDFCSFDPSVTSCEAILGLKNDADCPCEGFGALCRTVGSRPNKCTYACSTAAECFESGPNECIDDEFCG